MKEKVFKSVMLFVLLAGIGCAATSCSRDDEDDLMNQLSPLFYQTDFFIDMLDVVYDRYDAFGSKAKESSDGAYTVTPMGRLIVVKKKLSSQKVSYDDLERALANRYKSNPKVHEVYQNSGGTITIDCRK